jgi:FkbM family methyltransferase
MLERILKPHYLYRPNQAGRRLVRALTGSLPRSAVVTLPWGLPLLIDATEAIGRQIWHLGVHDLAVGETLWRLVGRGDLALDVGANLGHMTSIMALRAGPTGRVLCFEPHPEVFRRLGDNLALFNRHASHAALAAIEPSPAALGAEVDTAFLETTELFAKHHGTARLTRQRTSIPVRVTTLDAELRERTAAVVKIDVEGGELDVLAGGARALGEGRIRSIVYEGHPPARRALADLLGSFGYHVRGLGWNLRGLVLSGATEAPSLPPFQPPNFLATLDPDSVLPRLRPRGWQIL